MTRRTLIQLLGAAAALFAGTPLVASGKQALSLQGAARSSGTAVGVWLDPWMLTTPAFVQVILDNFNHAVIGNLKWDFIQKSSEAYDFSGPDTLVAFCRQHGLTMHGHNLCWNASAPQWLTKTLTSANAQDLLTTHIQTVMGRYRGSITSYDVVNEPIALWMNRPDGLYKGPWLDALGPQYIDIAFHAAERADPSALRVLNTTHDEQVTDRKSRAKTLEVIEELLKRGVPIQAVGMESHLFGTVASGADPDRAAFLAALRGLGLKVMVSELDVNDSLISGDIPTRDAAVANQYSEYISSMLASTPLEWIAFFSLSDKHNWYELVHGPAYDRPDGSEHRPGLLDANFSPKPAFFSSVSALRNAHMLS